MQNVGQGNSTESQKLDKVNPHEVGKSSPQSSNSSPTKSETDTFSELQPRFISDSSESEDDDVSEVESFVIDQGELEEGDSRLPSKFLLSQEDSDHSVDPETQARLEALLEAAGIGKLATGDGKQLADPEVLRRLTSSVSCALDEAAAALTRMRNENPRPQPERSLVEACTDGDVGTVRKLLTEGRSVHETTEEGESLLSLACSAGYYELAQVLLAMHANVEDRGIKGDCTPLMEAASAGYVDIVRLLIHHGADVNAQSSSGNTPLMYACAGGHEEAVRVLLDAGANVEDHNENGHTPLMEAASAGHVAVAAILLERGAGINTHSNEFKESALTLACYKGHLDMVRFLLEAGADQEHKTDEMHTALMEASMDGHVEVARLLLDSGAQVNMPTDSFESPLTLAACGGHVDLALLLIERGANIEEVNDEGYTPLMEAAREGHEEMVSVLLSKGANINTQTEETQETALTLACCGGFLEVADFLIKNGAELEMGASTPLMEAAQEGHLDLVRYLLEAKADVNAQTQTGDTALTYSCENGHTEVARLLLEYGANLEHESEGGRTPLMKACRAGHLCTVQFLLSKKADVNKQTTNNDHTPLSLASAGGHIAVVELLLAHHADPFHKLKDNSTMLIEAAKGGHTNVVQLLLDYPHSIMMSGGASIPPLHDIPDALRALSNQDEPFPKSSQPPTPNALPPGKHIAPVQKSLLRKARLPTGLDSNSLTSPEVQQVRNQPGDGKEDPNILDKGSGGKAPLTLDPQFFQRQQIMEELQSYSRRIEQELKEKGSSGLVEGLSPTTPPGPPPDPPAEVVQLLCDGVVCPPSPSVFHSPPPPPPIPTPPDVALSTAISDRPKAKPAWKKDGKSVRKQAAFQAALQHHSNQLKHLAHISDQHLSVLQGQDEMMVDVNKAGGVGGGVFNAQHMLSHVQPLEMSSPIHLHHPPLDRNIQELSGSCELLQRRCPLLTDEETLMDLAKGKFDQANLEDTLDSLSLEDMTGRTGTRSDRERLRLNTSALMAGVEVASKALMGSQNNGGLIGGTAALPPPSATSSATTSPFQVVPTDSLGLQIPSPAPPPDQPPPSLQYLYNVPTTTTPPVQGVGNFQLQCQARQELLNEKTRSRLDGGPPMVSTPQAPIPFQPHLLKPPPWSKEVVSSSSTVGREQVQTGTQTSPSVVSSTSVALAEPPPLSSGKKAPIVGGGGGGAPVPIQSMASAPLGGKKKARLQQQQKSTQAPPVHLDPNQIEAVSGTGPFSCMDVDSATDSNNDTALTLACAGGHDELVELLLSRGANIEHRDKKGFTPLILAATAGHDKVVEILLNHSADMEAQSERTKDTPLSLACSGGRYEVVELLLSRSANKEHRNVSDYTPLSLAASGGYVNIIKLLLSHGAEINSRTGSKLGISPLMLAAMNGHTAAVKLLLDMGSDINAQIETNRNTALTLACFQGRHEVVSLLLDRRANVEHRAKTGLTPLMEAASGGYVEVGRVLLDKGADVNAPPVPSSRDTALTIAADKGHCRFVELLLNRSAQVEVKNKKGNSPLWLAANGGHLAVVELLYNVGADIDSQDNRKVSCLMAAFRKGHVKVVKWMVNHVMQFPSDQEMTRYISTVSDKELLEKCQECIKIIRVAKDQQAAKANKNATILLNELFLEKTREESKRAAAARRRERKKKKKLEKKEEKRKLQEENLRNEAMSQGGEVEPPQQEEDQDEDDDEEEEKQQITVPKSTIVVRRGGEKRGGGVEGGGDSPGRGVGEGEEGDSGIDANSQGSCSSNEVKTQGVGGGGNKRKEKKKKKQPLSQPQIPQQQQSLQQHHQTSPPSKQSLITLEEKKGSSSSGKGGIQMSKSDGKVNEKMSGERGMLLCGGNQGSSVMEGGGGVGGGGKQRGGGKGKPTSLVFESSRHPADREDFEATGSDTYKPKKNNYLNYCDDSIISGKGNNATSPKQVGKRDEGWKEVVRKYLNAPFRSKKVSVPLNAISRVIGRGGSNINAIRTATGAHIEVEKQSKGQGERIITLKGSTEATKQAHSLIAALIKDPDVDILQLLPKSAKSAAAVWEKSVNTAKSKPNKTSGSTSGSLTSTTTSTKSSTSAVKRGQMVATSTTKTTMSYTSVIMTSSSTGGGGLMGRGKGGGGSSTQTTFAAKLTSSASSISIPPHLSQVIIDGSVSNGGKVGILPPQSQSSLPMAVVSAPTPPPLMSQSVTAPPLPPLQSSIPIIHSVGPPPPISASSSIPHSSTSNLPPSVVAPPNPSSIVLPSSVSPAPPLPAPSSILGPSASTTNTPTTTTATLEYSLFNDTFTKVAQQSMWGGRESESQKGMNFASVAATAAPSAVLAPTPNKFLEPSQPQVDASKAPGYRPGSVCSPVSKTGGSSSSSSSSSGSGGGRGGGRVTPPTSSYFPPPPPTMEPPAPLRVYQPPPDPPQSTGGVEILYPMSRLNPRAPDFSAPTRGLYPTQQPPPPPAFSHPPSVVPFPPVPTNKRDGNFRGGNSRWGVISYEMVDDGVEKVPPPRPIGTERASWKSLQEEWGVSWGGGGGGGDNGGGGVVGGGRGGPPPLFRPPFPPHQPPPPPPPRIHHQELHHHHIPIDTTPYQGGLEGVGGYNGGLMLPVIGPFGATDMEPPPPPAWDRLPIQDPIHDKPHLWLRW